VVDPHLDAAAKLIGDEVAGDAIIGDVEKGAADAGREVGGAGPERRDGEPGRAGHVAHDVGGEAGEPSCAVSTNSTPPLRIASISGSTRSGCRSRVMPFAFSVATIRSVVHGKSCCVPAIAAVPGDVGSIDAAHGGEATSEPTARQRRRGKLRSTGNRARRERTSRGQHECGSTTVIARPIMWNGLLIRSQQCWEMGDRA
jgi:hypothetical protein